MVFHGGRVIDGGYFLNRDTLVFETIPPEGGYLPGGSETSYIRLSTPLVAVTGSLAGLAYAILLPPFLFGTFFYLLFRWGAKKLKSAGSKGA